MGNKCLFGGGGSYPHIDIDVYDDEGCAGAGTSDIDEEESCETGETLEYTESNLVNIVYKTVAKK
jgi:hypothetical protein